MGHRRMQKIKKILATQLKNYLYITLGVILVGAAYNWFIIPLGISAGGVSGIAIIANIISGVPIALVAYVLNILLLVVAFFCLHRDVFYRSLYGSLLLPAMFQLIPQWQFFTGDTLLAIIFGAIFMGLGFGIIFAYGGSTGGTSIVPYILQKYVHMPKAVGFFLADSVVISLNLLTGNVIGIFYGVLCIIIANTIANYFETGFDKKRSFYIISSERDKIQLYIHQEIKRGTTILHASGGYRAQQQDIILGIVSMSELQKIKEYALAVDPSAFIIIGSVSEVHGQGFTLENNKK
jgi:uncharacterized membrane-anchored protein YitT (DUF2179 family)